MGTANNLAGTINGSTNINSIIRSLKDSGVRPFDVGRIEGLKQTEFFLEGMGVGVFPRLMKEMKRQESREDETPKEEIRSALQILYDIVMAYKPKPCELEIDGKDHSGSYVLLEIMNIRSVGPNLFLAPDADPGDGLFDVVLIRADEQHRLAAYVLNKIKGVEVPFEFEIIKARTIRLKSDGMHAHIDDELIRMKKQTPLHIELLPGLLEFVVTAD